MKNIEKSAEPASLKAFKTQNPMKWETIHAEENKNVYEDCILQCMEDQNNLCGYTEVLLNEQYHIDHFIKRSFDREMTFEWENMIASIHDSRFGADFKDENITSEEYDSRKKRYHHILSPIWDDLSNRFVYLTNGKIMPADPNDEQACQTIKIFNLNEASLCNRRKRTMAAIRNMLHGKMTKEEITHYLADAEFPTAIAYELSMADNDSDLLKKMNLCL